MSFVLGVIIATVINVNNFKIPQPTQVLTEYVPPNMNGNMCIKWESKLNNKGMIRSSDFSDVQCPERLRCLDVESMSRLKAFLMFK